MIPSHRGVAPPWIIAHRGASAEFPENTRLAFDAALRQGADAIELDLQLSQDGVPVVFHDRTLSRAGGGRRRVASLPLDTLRELDAGTSTSFAGQRIPTLAEVLRRYGKRTRLLLEIKARASAGGTARHGELLHQVIEQVRRGGDAARVALLCFDFALLDAAAAAAPELPRVLNLRPPPRLGGVLRRRLATLAALSTDVRTLTPGFAAALGRAGRPLLVYTCNTPAQVRRALACGAVGIMSDRPGWLAARVAEELEASA